VGRPQWLESADASSAELFDAAMADLVRTRELISADPQSCLSSGLSVCRSRLNEAGAGVALSAWQSELLAGTTRSRLSRWGSGGADGVHGLVEQVAERLCLV